MTRNLLTLTMSVLFCSALFAQNNSLWKNATAPTDKSTLKERASHPKSFRTTTLDVNAFLQHMKKATPRFENLNAVKSNKKNSITLSVPMPDGTLAKFAVQEAELMHPDLAAKFPQLKAYAGKGLTDKTADIRITYSPYFGFNGMILSGKHSTVYIDPLTKDNKTYMSFYRKNVEKTDQVFSCMTDESGYKINAVDKALVPALGDCNLRRYRLAQSCTGEYAQYHIGAAGGTTGTTAGDKAIVQAAMNVTMNRVNGVYERDLGITMQFVANNDLIIYLNANSDPWTNEWNTKTAQTCDAQIGVNNYDIGHNFNTTGGGSAGCIDCVCLSQNQNGTHKGRGYTGQTAPVGDLFDIDYVAHEMGHQFGGFHTQSNSNCRSGDGSTEVEPGSASTIMGYAGICAANVQNQSDDYFAYVNIRDIVTSANFGNASGCAELIVSGNSGPTADAGSDYSIPVSTPFILTGVGTDADDAGLTYCWEQNDPENPNSNSAPPTTRTQGPMFRSLQPVASPVRYMPNLTDVINNVSPTWEVLPSVSRNMEFSFTVRDNNTASGCTALDLMNVTTVAAAGPFLVTAPNTEVTWGVGDIETVTWDVAGTTAAPVSCANVDILLSTDGGLTYPITLATNVPNDGSHNVTVPNNPGTTTRVMIVCSDNIFYDISNVDFSIIITAPSVNITNASSATSDEGTNCNTRDITFDITLSQQPSASTDVTWAFSGTADAGDYSNASGTTHTFTTANWATPYTVTLTVEQDAVIEADETIVIDVTSVTGSDAVPGTSSQMTISLKNDDNDPAAPAGNVTLISEAFEGGLGAFTQTSTGDPYVTGDAAALASAYWSVTGNATNFAFINDDECNCDMSDVQLISPTFDLTGATAASLTFDHAFAAAGETAEVLVSTNNGSTYTSVLVLSNPGSTNTGGGIYVTPWVNGVTVDLTPYVGNSQVKVSFKYNDNGIWGYGMAVDNVLITRSSPPVDIQTATNTGAGFAEHDLGPNQTVYFYDQATGNIMVKIENLTAHDYGCTKVEVDRAGIDGTAWFIGNITNKTFKVTPEFNNPAGAYNITLYYKTSEILGFYGSIQTMGKGAVSIDNGTNNGTNSYVEGYSEVAFNGDYTFTSTFTTGFSGFGMTNLPPGPLPVELLDFTAAPAERAIQLDWTTVTEINNAGFEVERSLFAAEGFEKIGWVAGQGNSSEKHEYDLLDRNVESGVTYFYRLKQVDTDGTFSYSKVVSARLDSDELEVTIMPNPAKEVVQIVVNDDEANNIRVQIYNIQGQLLLDENTNLKENNTIILDIHHFATGHYMVKVGSDTDFVVKKLIIE